MMLTETQIDYIESELIQRGVTVPSLQEDLLDHFCCAIEERLSEGELFEAAYHQAYMEICPDGVQELDRATQIILLHQKFSTMKKLTFIIGFSTSFLFIVGCFFKVMHWPGANELMLFDAILFSLVFLPLFFLMRFKADQTMGKAKPKWNYVLNNFAIGFMVMAVPYTAIKLPGALYVMLMGMALFLLVFLPKIFLSWYRNLNQETVRVD